MTEFRTHNVLATFDDMDRAREAILELERGGLEGSGISLLARDGDTREPTEATPDTREDDRDLGGDVGKRVGSGAAIGTAAGGATGFFAGLAAFAIPGVGPVIGAGVWASTLAGAAGGGAVGGVVAGVSGVGTSDAWRETYASIEEDRVVVGYHAEDPSEVDRAEKHLRQEEPLDLARYDARGDRVS